jgi:hypothetical protein
LCQQERIGEAAFQRTVKRHPGTTGLVKQSIKKVFVSQTRSMLLEAIVPLEKDTL